MTKTITQDTVADLLSQVDRAPHKEQLLETITRLSQALNSLERRHISSPNISQVALEMGITRQQLTFWFAQREQQRFDLTSKDRQVFATWFFGNIDSFILQPVGRDVTRFISKCELIKAFRAHFKRRYPKNLAGASRAFWSLLEEYSAKSRSSKINGEYMTYVSIRHYGLKRLRQDNQIGAWALE